MHNQKWDISDAQSSTDLHGCLVLDAVASTLDARASTADGLDAAASTHGLDAWPRRLDASGAWSHSTPPLDTSTLARRYSLDVCSTLGSTQARRLDARAQCGTLSMSHTQVCADLPCSDLAVSQSVVCAVCARATRAMSSFRSRHPTHVATGWLRISYFFSILDTQVDIALHTSEVTPRAGAMGCRRPSTSARCPS